MGMLCCKGLQHRTHWHTIHKRKQINQDAKQTKSIQISRKTHNKSEENWDVTEQLSVNPLVCLVFRRCISWLVTVVIFISLLKFWNQNFNNSQVKCCMHNRFLHTHEFRNKQSHTIQAVAYWRQGFVDLFISYQHTEEPSSLRKTPQKSRLWQSDFEIFTTCFPCTSILRSFQQVLIKWQ